MPAIRDQTSASLLNNTDSGSIMVYVLGVSPCLGVLLQQRHTKHHRDYEALTGATLTLLPYLYKIRSEIFVVASFTCNKLKDNQKPLCAYVVSVE